MYARKAFSDLDSFTISPKHKNTNTDTNSNYIHTISISITYNMFEGPAASSTAADMYMTYKQEKAQARVAACCLTIRIG